MRRRKLQVIDVRLFQVAKTGRVVTGQRRVLRGVAREPLIELQKP